VKHLLRALIVSLLLVALLGSAIGAVRWAKRVGTAAGLAANALLLSFGMGLIVTPPQRGVQQVQEEDDKTGGESGDPPS
jgi:hypothetical protein